MGVESETYVLAIVFPATVFATLPFCFLKLGERGSKLPL